MAPAQPTSLRIVIDRKVHVIHDNDLEGASLLRLVGRDPKVFDLFLIDENGIEVMIRDDQIVNIKDDAEFVSRQKIRFTTDGEPYTTYDNDQSASSLLQLAGLNPDHYDLARITPTGAPETFRDEQIVSIKDGDSFITARRVGGVA